MTEEPSHNLVKSTQRSFEIIETLRELDGARLTDVAAALDLPNSTVYNHLTTLIECGYVVRKGNTYGLSLQFLDLGEYTRSRQKLHDAGCSEIDDLAEMTGEVVSILVEEAGVGIYICLACGANAVPLDIRVGKRVYLHTTALGKCILAGLPKEDVKKIFETHGLAPCTENTIVDREALFAELEAVRERGIAHDREERVNGVACIAAPLRTEKGKVLGALSISGPAQRFSDDETVERYIHSLHNSTNIIELKLAYS